MEKWNHMMPLMAPEGAGGMAGAAGGAEGATAPGAQGGGEPQSVQPAEKTPEMQFEELKNGALKPQFDNWAKSAFETRMKNLNGQLAAQRQQAAKMAPIMEAVAHKYGLAPDDVDGIAAKVAEDDSLYAEAASAKGMSVKSYRQMQQIMAENQRYRQQQQQQQQEMVLRQHYDRIQQQLPEMKKMYPDFDLEKEMQDPRFAAMTGPGVGLGVLEAYRALHYREIEQQTINRTVTAASQAVQSGTMRPQEAGTNAQQGQVDPRTSPRNWTDAQFQQAWKELHAKGRLNFR